MAKGSKGADMPSWILYRRQMREAQNAQGDDKGIAVDSVDTFGF